MSKLLRFAAMFALACGLVRPALAYQVIVVDPNVGSISGLNTVLPIEACGAVSSDPTNPLYGYDSCARGENDEVPATVITGVSVFLPDSVGTGTCGAFSAANCVVTIVTGGDLFSFTGLDVQPDHTLIIGIGVATSTLQQDLPNGLATTVTTAATPEPQSLWLLSTGMMTSAGLYLRRRKAQR